MLPQQLIEENAELAAIGRPARHIECPLHIISRFQELWPNHIPILSPNGELSQIWDNISDSRERGGITDQMFDLFEGLIPSCSGCGGNGSDALHPLCFSCEAD